MRMPRSRGGCRGITRARALALDTRRGAGETRVRPIRVGARPFLIALVLTVSAVATDAPGAHAAPHSCKDVIYRVNATVYARTYELKANRVGCRTARRVARGWLAGAEGVATPPKPLGFKCSVLADDLTFKCTKH